MKVKFQPFGVKRIVTLIALILVVTSMIHRCWLQFRPLPMMTCVNRPMTQNEWEIGMRTNSPVPTNAMVTDNSPYPSTNGEMTLTSWDIQKIRALASWSAVFPYRTTLIQVWSRTNVTLQTYERKTTQLEVIKDASGWHMTPVRGEILWVSEDAKSILSFH